MLSRNCKRTPRNQARLPDPPYRHAGSHGNCDLPPQLEIAVGVGRRHAAEDPARTVQSGFHRFPDLLRSVDGPAPPIEPHGLASGRHRILQRNRVPRPIPANRHLQRRWRHEKTVAGRRTSAGMNLRVSMKHRQAMDLVSPSRSMPNGSDGRWRWDTPLRFEKTFRSL